jgi:diguanylate cyclase (GGDEF)-like protein
MTIENSSLVIVEDNPADMTLYLRLLEDLDHGFEHIECLSTIEGAANCLANSTTPACCLLDFNLPDGSALTLLESLQANNHAASCPIVVVTGQEDTKNAVRLLKLGVQDYVVKDELTSHTLLKTIKNAIKNWQLSKQLEQMALYDSLTGLTNRGLFMDKLEQTFNESKRYKRQFCLLLIDLDRFKSINDIYGHEAGDFVLTVVGKKLINFIRVTDIAGRLGGDEFAVVLSEIDEKAAHVLIGKLLKALTIDVIWNNSVIPISPSIGFTMHPSRAQDCKQLIREADIALYQAKEKGRSQYVAYKKNGKNHDDKRELLKDALPVALLGGKLQVAFQPIVSATDSEKVYAIEALTRWHHEGHWVNPIETVNLVMELGLDMDFHRWLLGRSFSQLQAFQVFNPDLKLSLNLPANVCHNPNFSELVVKLCEQYNVAPSSVILEVTETQLMPQPEKARECLLALVEANFHVAIDDFGTGYSSMEYIADLPCTILKIDKKFFLELAENQRNKNIIEATTVLAHGLGMLVVAEGIENQFLCESAQTMNCDFLQGYHTGYPVIPESDWAAFITQARLPQSIV